MNRGSYTVPRVDESSEVFQVRDKRNGQWFWAHNAVIDRAAPHLGAAALAVYFALCRFASAEQTSFPSYQTIGDRLGLTRYQVRRCIEKLAAYGLIHIEHTPSRHPNVYTLLDPEAWRLPSADGTLAQKGTKQESAWEAEKPAPATCAEAQLCQNAEKDPPKMPMESENCTLAQLCQPDPNGKNPASEGGDSHRNKTHQEDKIRRDHHGAAGAAEGGAGGAGDDDDLTQILSRLGVTNPSGLIEKAFGHGWTREGLVEAIQRLESTDRVKNKAGFLVKIITEGPQRAEAILNYYDPPQSGAAELSGTPWRDEAEEEPIYTPPPIPVDEGEREKVREDAVRELDNYLTQMGASSLAEAVRLLVAKRKGDV